MVYTLTVHLYANDDPASIPRLKAKLVEAARVYRRDRETVDWLVMQDVHDPRAFTIVERFETEAVCIPSPIFFHWFFSLHPTLFFLYRFSCLCCYRTAAIRAPFVYVSVML